MSVRMYLAPIAVLLTLGLAGCSGVDAAAPASTVTVTTTVTQSATVTETAAAPAVTSPAASPTPAQTGPHLGLVWASQVDSERVNQPSGSQPTFDGDGITSRIDMILYVDASAVGELSEECSSAIEIFGDNPDDTHCLFVQWTFDVPKDYDADDANLSPGPLLTPEGLQITSGFTTSGVPGAKDVVMRYFYGGGVPGSTLRWNVGSNEQGRETYTYEVPEVESFRPISFD